MERGEGGAGARDGWGLELGRGDAAAEWDEGGEGGVKVVVVVWNPVDGEGGGLGL